MALALFASACSAESAHPEGDASRSEPIIHGELSGDDQNSVVLLWNDQNTSWCTGALIAPTLVLTARHCLFRYASPLGAYVYCNESGAVSPVFTSYDPKFIEVNIGSKTGPELEAVAVGLDIHSGSELDLCKNDVAILEIDTPLDLDVYPLRLDAPPVKGETGLLVGWGGTEEDVDAKRLRLTDARRKREIEVLAVGPISYRPPGGSTRFIEDATFVGSEGGCDGDSGGPLFSNETGAIFGIMHATQRLDPSLVEGGGVVDHCLGGLTVFHRLETQAEWIRRAFASVGAAPWLEGRPPPAEPGASCELGYDCLSGLCIQSGNSAFCSSRCDDTACPDGLQCVGPDDERVCVLPRVESAEPASDGCAVTAVGSRRSTDLTWFVLAVIGFGALTRSVRRPSR